MTGFDDTICALATGSCNGAISVIRISGKDCFRIVDAVVSFAKGSASESNGGCVKYGMIEGIDEVLVSIFRAPRSYTGEDSAEISCHASRVIVDRILALLVEKGARSAMPGEFSKRAFLNGKLDLSQAEAVADLIAASSEASARVALNQLKGKYSSELRTLRRSLLEISSLLELELDFSEEDVEFADRKKLTGLVESVIERVDGLASTFKQGNAIKSGVNVAIAGPVNSGKSTLLNALLGEERAIVSDVPGTTRDTVEEVLELSGVLYRFTDTAGIRESRDKVERMGIERTMDKLGTADTVIAVIDGSFPIEEVRRSFPSLIEKVSDAQRLIVVRNKVDIFDAFAPEEFPRVDRFYGVLELKYPAFGTYMYSPEQLAEELGFKADASMEKGSGPESVPNGRRYGIIDISAKTGEGLDELRRCITDGRTEIDANAVLVTNQRHYEALLRSSEALHRVRTDLETSLTPDLLSEDLRIAINELSSIFGEITSDEVLGSIFERFCIGK